MQVWFYIPIDQYMYKMSEEKKLQAQSHVYMLPIVREKAKKTLTYTIHISISMQK